jgi:predicted amidohydrolase
MSATVRVAAIQCPAEFAAIERNAPRLTALIREGAAGGAKIIVLPELALTGYVAQDLSENWHVHGRPIDSIFRGCDPVKVAQPIPGATTDFFCALAKELRIYLTIPVLECAAGEYFNSVCLAAPDGRLVTHYRKLNPWPPTEQSWATPGDRRLATYDTEYGRIGIAICYDIHTILPRYAQHHLWCLLFPSAWVDDGDPADWFHRRLPAMVANYGHYLVGANWSVERPQRWRGYGHSTIIAPDGRVLATAQSLYRSEIVYADLVAAPSSEFVAIKEPR